MIPELTKFLDAPFPYFVGIPPHTWRHVTQHTELVSDEGEFKEEALIFDLDRQTYVRNLNLPPIPEPAATVLLENLRTLSEKKGRFVESCSEPRARIVNGRVSLGGTLLGLCHSEGEAVFLQLHDSAREQLYRVLLQKAYRIGREKYFH